MNVPEIRFKEFCDYYSDVLLEKCLSVSNKKNNKLEYKKEDALSVNPEKPDVPLNKNDAFQKVQKRRVQEKR